jgi:hypothetical protein
MDELCHIEEYLRSIVSRKQSNDADEEIGETLKQIKQDAVARDDQDCAKTIWCYEQILKIQNLYLSAFTEMREHYFYPAWCTLERVEIELHFLERHLRFHDCEDDPYKLEFIYEHTTQFQSLFPYKMFFSPAYIAHEKVCTICEKPISIRNPCGHVVGEIYNGEQCGRRITSFDILEISMVDNPVQKYSVAWVSKTISGFAVDPFNYASVDYVMRELRTPFSGWNMKWTKTTSTHSSYKNVGRNDRCPCGSGEKFKKCCIKKDKVEHKHLSIVFEEPPPRELSAYEEGKFVQGLGAPLPPSDRPNLLNDGQFSET